MLQKEVKRIYSDIRELYPYAIKLIDNKWFLVNRGYNIISKEYILEKEDLKKIIIIARKLKGNYIEFKNNEVRGIWFYDDGFVLDIKNKGYLNLYYESINELHKLLNDKN